MKTASGDPVIRVSKIYRELTEILDKFKKSLRCGSLPNERINAYRNDRKSGARVVSLLGTENLSSETAGMGSHEPGRRAAPRSR
jgi:hypothetical protein